MNEKIKKDLQREMKRVVQERARLNEVIDEDTAQEIIKKIIGLINDLNLMCEKTRIPFITVKFDQNKINIEPKELLEECLDSKVKGSMEKIEMQKCSDTSFQKVIKFLNETFGEESAENSYTIVLLN